MDQLARKNKDQSAKLERRGPIRSSVVIVALNSESTIDACIKSIKQQSLPAKEIVVIDNGSTDSTATIARKNGARVVSEPIPGRGRARNRGLREAKEDFVVYIDSDAYADRDWLRYLLLACKNSRFAGVTGNVYAANPNRPIPHLIDLMMRDKKHYATLNIVYRKKVLEKVEGFDERLGNAEDVELAWRVLRAGYKIGYEPRSIVYHFHRENLTGFLRQQYDFGKWSVIARRLNNMPTWRQELLMLAAPLTIFKHIKEIRKHPLLPPLLTLASIAYSAGLSKGLSVWRMIS
jgi:glycosyltransferase involved in cell wall biosynthesis